MEVLYFYCPSCGYEDFNIFVAYNRTSASGDLCLCPECNEESIIFEVEQNPQAEQATASSLSELLSSIKLLIEKFEKLEDNNLKAAETINHNLHARDTFAQAGTVYGICAEELRILIGMSA